MAENTSPVLGLHINSCVACSPLHEVNQRSLDSSRSSMQR
jgi:hypothetical protein